MAFFARNTAFGEQTAETFSGDATVRLDASTNPVHVLLQIESATLICADDAALALTLRTSLQRNSGVGTTILG